MKEDESMKKVSRRYFFILCLVFLLLPIHGFAVGNYGADLSSSAYVSSTNPFFRIGLYGQCTWYCWGRAYEKGVAFNWNNGSFGNAIYWYDRAKSAGYNCDTTASANSIMVSPDGGYYDNYGNYVKTGHVMFVEKVEGDYAYISEANYTGTGKVAISYGGYSGYYHEDIIKLSTGRRNSGNGMALSITGYIHLTPPGPPTNCNVVTDKTVYNLGETVTINASATGMNFYTVRVELNGQTEYQNVNQNTGPVSFTPTKAGHYTVHAACCADWSNYSEALYYFDVLEPTIDVNFFVNGTSTLGMDGIGTFQVYVDGVLQTDHGVSSFTDFCRAVPAGKSYRISVNITNPDFFFAGVDTSEPGYSGLTGTTGTGGTKVRLVICRSTGYEQAIPGGDYLIANAGTTDKTTFYLLDIEGDAHPAANGTNVSLCGPFSGNATPCEIWTVSYQDGFFSIKQKGTEMALDLESASTIQGSNVRVRQSNDSDAQKWEIIPNGRNGYRIQAKCSGFSLHISGGNTRNGANVVQCSNNDMAAQSWLFIPCQPSQPIQNGRYVLLSAVDPSFEVDVAGDTGDIPDETNVEIWKDTAPSRYNSFNVTALDNGYYSIIHAASGKALDVTNGLSTFGANIALHEYNGSIAQQWAIREGSNGYELRARCSGLVMELPDSKTVNGTNIQQWAYTGGRNHAWYFVPAEYTVNYDANGGINEPARQTKFYKEDLVLRKEQPTRNNYDFLGWSSSNIATTPEFLPGGTYTTDAGTTLYAVWNLNTPTYQITATSSSGTFTAHLTGASSGDRVFFAAYKDGRMADVQCATYQGEDLRFTPGADYDSIKIMLLDVFFHPLCHAWENNSQ